MKISEKHLRSIVRESVYRILNEIDWKTYASAADKRRKQAREFSKSFDFDNMDIYKSKANALDIAASKALSDKYGKTYHTYGNYYDDDRIVKDNSPLSIGTNDEGPEPLGYYYTSSKDRDWRNGTKEFKYGDADVYGDIPIDFDWSDVEDRHNNEVGREVDNFVHGRYEYDPNKGWKLKK